MTNFSRSSFFLRNIIYLKSEREKLSNFFFWYTIESLGWKLFWIWTDLNGRIRIFGHSNKFKFNLMHINSNVSIHTDRVELTENIKCFCTLIKLKIWTHHFDFDGYIELRCDTHKCTHTHTLVENETCVPYKTFQGISVKIEVTSEILFTCTRERAMMTLFHSFVFVLARWHYPSK